MSGNKALTRAVSLDCEMVGTGPRGCISMAARVSVVTDFRTPVSGIEPHHLDSGRPLYEVKMVVADLIRGGILVGHDVEKDLRVLRLCHPEENIRDTAYYPPIRINPHNKPSLKYLAKEYAGMNIQNGWHSSVRDARAAMMVYKQFEEEWEDWLNEASSEEESTNQNNYYYDSSSSSDYY